MNKILQFLLSNPHTTAAAAIYAFGTLVSSVIVPVLQIWYPDHKSQLQQTSDVITNALKAAGITYGLVAAGDAAKSASKKDVQEVRQDAAQAVESGNTTLLKKNGTKL